MAGVIQSDLFGAPPAPIEGLRYQADLIAPAQADALLDALAALPFRPFDFHGHQANREVVSFGFRYDYGRREITEAAEIPAFLLPLRAKVAQFAGLAPDDFRQVLINLYRPGAGIGWHRDKPHFDRVAGVSLGAPATLRFRRRDGAGWERRALSVAPRSAYLFSGPARHDWQHSIAPLDRLRYSITFRTLAT